MHYVQKQVFPKIGVANEINKSVERKMARY